MPQKPSDGVSTLENGPLAHSPSTLEENRSHFNRTPEGTTTIPQQSPVQQQPELGFPSTWEYHLKRHALTSVPIGQFDLHNFHQEERMQVALHNGTRSLQDGHTCSDAANEIVKRDWVYQGIWDHNWSKQRPYTMNFMTAWMHETPNSFWKSRRQQDQSAYKAATALTPGDFHGFKNWRVDDKLARSGEASRPIYQFVYQVKTELDWYEECSKVGVELPTTEAELAVKAHEAVRSRWMKWHLWNSRWGDLPGLTWRHEMTFEEMRRQKMEDHNVQDEDATSIASDSTFHSDLGLPIPFEEEFVLEHEHSPYKPPRFLQPYDGSYDPPTNVGEDTDSVAAAKERLVSAKPPAWHQKLSSRWSKARQKEIMIGRFDSFFYFRHRPSSPELFLVGFGMFEWRMTKRIIL